jgi:integrase
VLRVLEPKWRDAPETMSRLRGRIEVVLAAAQVAGWIDPDKPNPARWRGWLDHMLANPKKIGDRGHHAALGYASIPALMARLAGTEGAAAKALRLVILTASRTSEVLGMRFDEVDFDSAVWRVPANRMKTNEVHEVPLSDAAVAILRAQEAQRGENLYVFPGRPMRGLSNMALLMLLRRMGVAVTAHGMRTSFRTWCSEVAHVEFELAELCLSHRIGSAVSRLQPHHHDRAQAAHHVGLGAIPERHRRRQRDRASQDRGVIPVEVTQTMAKKGKAGVSP